MVILLILGPLGVLTYINTIYDDYFDNRSDLISPDEKQTSETKGSGVPNENDAEKVEVEERYTGQVFKKTDNGDCLISIPEKARTINGKKEMTYILTVGDCEFDANEPVEVVFGGKLSDEKPIKNEGQSKSNIDTGVSKENKEIPVYNTPASQILVKPLSNMQTFETLSLITTRSGQDIILKYNDSSDKTLNVTVTLRNSNEEIFSGNFKSSKFEALVKDVSKDSPYIIEMIIIHEIHGKVSSSVYSPSGNNDNVINGVFATG